MPKFRPRLNTVREENKGKPINPSRRIEHIQARYAHLPHPKLNANTLYRPILRPSSTKRAIKPRGNSWNLFLKELNRPASIKHYRKYTESMKPMKPKIRPKTKRVPTLYLPRTTEQENIELLKKELKKNGILGSKI